MASSQTRGATMVVAVAAAAMVTMAGTVWLMKPATFEEDSTGSEEFDVTGKRKPKSSLSKSSALRRNRRSRRVHWPESSVIVSPSSASSKSLSASTSYQCASLAQRRGDNGLSPASASAFPPQPPLTADDSSKENQQSSLVPISEGNAAESQDANNKLSSVASASLWSSPSSPLATIKKLQASAANLIMSSAANMLPKRQDDADDSSMSRNRTVGDHHFMGNGESSSRAASSSFPTSTGQNYYRRHHHDQTTSTSTTPTTPYLRFIQHLKPLRPDAWAEPDAESCMVRGPSYLTNGKKIPSTKPAFSLLTVDLIQHLGQAPYYHPICGHPRERVQQAIKREEEFGSAEKELPPFVFAVNLCLPSSAVSSNHAKNGSNAATNHLYYHQVSYFGIENMDEIENEMTPFGMLMKKFIFGDDDDFRDRTFKLIPRIVKGNLLVRRAVGSKPAIIGRKVKQHYFRGDRYFEILVDVGSDSIADRIVRLALGYAKSLITEICFVLEGTSIETLPERIFGGVTLKHIDFKSKDGDRRMLPLDYTPYDTMEC